MAERVDAVVIGSGPNGLVAANMLADAGLEVLVVEEATAPGGAVRSGELTVGGFTHDLFSSFYPLAAASPPIGRLELERWGLRWRRGPLVVAHPAEDGTCPVLGSFEQTVASLEPGDVEGWRRLTDLWDELGDAFMQALTGPFPPLRPLAGIARRRRVHGTLELVRFAALPLRRMVEELGLGSRAARLIGGNALHADLAPETPGSALFGWVLVGLAQDVGFPVPEGGAGALSGALVRRLVESGGRLHCGARVDHLDVRGGRVRGVRTADAQVAADVVVADIGAPQLYGSLLDPDLVPAGLRRRLALFQYDSATVKVDWALRGPIPWTAPAARRSPVIHVAEDLDELTMGAARMATGQVPADPYLVMGQYSMIDETRQPAGAETAWAYTHVPQRITGDERGAVTGAWDARDDEAMVERIEARIERLAPGFRELIAGRHVFTPPTMQATNRNLVGGAVNGGTAQFHQQAIFRPVPVLRRYATPVPGLFLGSASAHPGGGVHGACGANAARAALSVRQRLRRRLAR
jgi:phytoene dehydrogenase-like protein